MRWDHWMGKILRLTQTYLQRNCHEKVHKMLLCMQLQCGQGGSNEAARGGGGAMQWKRGNKARMHRQRIFRCWCTTVLIHPVILQQREQDNYNMSRIAHWCQVECLFVHFSQSFPSVTPPGSAERQWSSILKVDPSSDLTAMIHSCRWWTVAKPPGHTAHMQHTLQQTGVPARTHTHTVWWALIVPLQSSVVSNDLNSSSI